MSFLWQTHRNLSNFNLSTVVKLPCMNFDCNTFSLFSTPLSLSPLPLEKKKRIRVQRQYREQCCWKIEQIFSEDINVKYDNIFYTCISSFTSHSQELSFFLFFPSPFSSFLWLPYVLKSMAVLCFAYYFYNWVVCRSEEKSKCSYVFIKEYYSSKFNPSHVSAIRSPVKVVGWEQTGISCSN